MDETEVRTGAETHGQATVEGNFKVAGSYLSPEAAAQAGGVMKAMPGKLSGSEVTTVEPEGDGFVVGIRYTGETGEVTVRSTWGEVDGATKITALEVL